MEDITESTSGIVFSDGSDEFNPKNTPLDTTSNSSPGQNSGAALDDLLKQTPSAKAAAPTDDNEDEALKDKAPAQAPAKGAAPAPTSPTAADEAKKKAAEEAAKKVAEPKDSLSQVSLGPHAKPATVKSFDEVKRLAREEISKRDAEIAELKAKLPKQGEELPEPVKKELDELRAFRKVHDFQNDTEFKRNFVEPVEANNKTIWTKLEASKILDEAGLAKAKEIGVSNLDWEPILAKLPPATRLSIQGLLVDNERIGDKRAQALEGAKNAPQEFADRQKKAEETRKSAEESATKQVIDAVLTKTDWFKETPVPPDATAEQKAHIESQNVFFKEQKGRLETILADNSPQMRGTLIAATLLAYQLQGQANLYKGQLEKANARIEKLTKSSSTRSKGNAPAAGDIPPAKAPLLMRGADALDSYRKEQVATD